MRNSDYTKMKGREELNSVASASLEKQQLKVKPHQELYLEQQLEQYREKKGLKSNNRELSIDSESEQQRGTLIGLRKKTEQSSYRARSVTTEAIMFGTRSETNIAAKKLKADLTKTIERQVSVKPRCY